MISIGAVLPNTDVFHNFRSIVVRILTRFTKIFKNLDIRDNFWKILFLILEESDHDSDAGDWEVCLPPLSKKGQKASNAGDEQTHGRLGSAT